MTTNEITRQAALMATAHDVTAYLDTLPDTAEVLSVSFGVAAASVHFDFPTFAGRYAGQQAATESNGGYLHYRLDVTQGGTTIHLVALLKEPDYEAKNAARNLAIVPAYVAEA